MMFAAPDGWTVEVMDLEGTTWPRRTVMEPDGDGEQFLVRYHGYTMGFVKTVPELLARFPLEGLAEVPA
jgi:hypothetical protein